MKIFICLLAFVLASSVFAGNGATNSKVTTGKAANRKTANADVQSDQAQLMQAVYNLSMIMKKQGLLPDATPFVTTKFTVSISGNGHDGFNATVEGTKKSVCSTTWSSTVADGASVPDFTSTAVSCQ